MGNEERTHAELVDKAIALLLDAEDWKIAQALAAALGDLTNDN